MQTEVLNLTDPQQIERAAVCIADGDIVGMYFNGTYAFLGDVDQLSAADRIFELKHRPRSKSLALVTAPRFLPDVVDMRHAVFGRYSIAQIQTLYQHVHALGIVLPADAHKSPPHLVVNGTILNVWTNFAPHNLLLTLQLACRRHGVRAFLGASANPSGQPTFTTVAQMLANYAGQIPVVFSFPHAVPAHRHKSTTLVDLTPLSPTMIREGNVPHAELGDVLQHLKLGTLTVSQTVKIL